ncbi:MAG: preprotein translocase subunit SecY [Firmicutes bacterium HGW-Firmicutes-7]|nr:MAG: preprotein translocase subunit SecY [Firmicutes bacterium HGW-Firmicutes-7]
MFKTIRDAFKVPDLRNKLLFTLLMLFVIRVGAAIPIPGINAEVLKDYFAQAGDLLGLFDAFSGGAFANMTLFAMGIIPYINASIIMNLLTIAIPALEEMQKEGEDGRKMIAKMTRYGTVILALVQSIAISLGLRNIFNEYNVLSVIIAVSAMTAGTAFLMWVGERINERGVGNGISLIIFVNILSRLPSGAKALYNQAILGKYIQVFAMLLVFLGMILLVVLIYLGERRIAVQYAKKMQGRKSYGGQSTHIPLKVNMAGVIPVIFASSLLQFPQVITGFFTQTPAPWLQKTIDFLNYYSSPFGAALYFTLIILFAFFYTAIIFNPYEVANNMKKNGGFIPGIRPGKPTVDYLTKILNKIVLIGGILLGIVAISPIALSAITKVQIGFGGTSLIIVVGVCLETIKQIESQLVMRHYKGFLNS